MFRKKNNRSTSRGDLRKVLVEPLEKRQLLAADAAAAFGSSFLIMDVSEDDFNGMGAMASVGQSFGMESGRTGFSGGSNSAPFQFLISGDDGSFTFEINESNAELFEVDVDFESGAVVSGVASGASAGSDFVEFEINEANMDAVLKGLPKDFKLAQPLTEGSYASEMYGAEVGDFESGAVVSGVASGANAGSDFVEFEINESNMDAVLKGLPKDFKLAQPLTEGSYASEMYGAEVGDFESGAVVSGVASGANAGSDFVEFEINESNMDAVLKGLPKDLKPAQPVTEGTYASELYGAEVSDFESGAVVSSSTSGAVADEVGFVLELNENGDGFSLEIDESMLGVLATGFPTGVTPSASTTSNGNVSQVGSGVSTGVLSSAKGGVSSQQNANSGAQVVVNRTQVGSTGVSKASSQPDAGLFAQQVMLKRLRAGAWSQQDLVDLALSDLLRV